MQGPDEEMMEPMQEQAPEQGMESDFQLQDASPEEQEQYERFVARAMQLMYSDKMRPKVRELLAGEGDPVEGLARASAMVIVRVALAAEKAGEKLMGDAVFEAGKSIIEDLAEYATKWGIHDFETNSKDLEGAYFRTLDMMRVMMQQAGRANPDTFKPDMDKLVQMNDSGELETMLRQLADYERNQRGQSEAVNDNEGEDGMPPQRGLASAAGGRR
jgi:hypothetical protein